MMGAAPWTGRSPSHRSKLATADASFIVAWAMATASSSVDAKNRSTASILRLGANERRLYVGMSVSEKVSGHHRYSA